MFYPDTILQQTLLGDAYQVRLFNCSQLISQSYSNNSVRFLPEVVHLLIYLLCCAKCQSKAFLVNFNQNFIQEETQRDLELAYQRLQQFSLDRLAGEEQKKRGTGGIFQSFGLKWLHAGRSTRPVSHQ